MAQRLVRCAAACFVSLALGCSTTRGAEPGVWGVVVHTPFHADALKAIGAQWVRVDVPWAQIESAPHVYDWSSTDKLLAYYLAHDFHVIAILGVGERPATYAGNDLHTLIPAISAWAGAAASRFRDRRIVWEIGNEPEVFPLGGLWSVPENYAQLARSVARSIKAADSHARLAALSVAWMDRNFIVRALTAGMLADGTIDAVTYHGYHRPQLTPESGLAEDIAWLRETLARHAPSGKQIAVIDSERGYGIVNGAKPWGNWRNLVLTEDEQAAYLARHYLESSAAGVEIVVWYKDMFGETDSSLYYADEKDPRGLRPMGKAYRTLARLLPDSPRQMRNDQFEVTLRKSVPKTSDPSTLLHVETFLRRQGRHEQLIIALWNPMEAANGRVLESRRRVGDDIVESWRTATPDDHVPLQTRVQIHDLDPSRITSITNIALIEDTSTPVTTTPEGASVVTEAVSVGAVPTMLVVELHQ